jgi:hypothetical protein
MVDLEGPPPFAEPPTLPEPAVPWAGVPALSAPVRVAQRLGLVGRRIRIEASS